MTVDRKAIAAACLLTMLVPAQAAATTVLTLRFNGEIWIAADSRLLVNGTEALSWCKVKNFGDVVLVNAGHSVYQHPQFPDLARILLADRRDPVDRIREFTQEAAGLQPNPRQRAEPAVPGDLPEPIAFTFGFFEDGLPVVELWSNQQGIVARDDATNSSQPRIRWIGQRSLLETIVFRVVQALYEEIGIGPALDLLIRLQSRVSPGVMPPVDIIRLTAAGAQWIQRKPECHERE